MAEKFELTSEMKSQIGWESPPWTYEVTSTSVRAFARGVGYTDPIYYDIEAARKAGYRNLPAPPCYLGTPVFIPGKSDETFSSPLSAVLEVKHGLTGLLDGGTETEYFNTICAGDNYTVTMKLANLEAKESKALGKMLVVSRELSFKNREGKIVAIQRAQTIFY